MGGQDDPLSELATGGVDPFEAVESLIALSPSSVAAFGWVSRIVFKHFATGMLSLTQPEAMQRKYRRFVLDADPIYSALLNGLDDEPLAATFVSYWKIAHTLATQSRFWLEDAIAEIVEQDPRWEGQKRRVYTARMLAAGMYQRGITLADLGEREREVVLTNRRPWEVLLQRSALQRIDQLVGEQERTGSRSLPEGWGSKEAIEQDKAHLKTVESALTGPPPETATLHCNLVIVEPDVLKSPHTWAFRFVNPRTMGSHAERKQERVNLLRLFAYFAQEKPLRDPRLFCVAIAEIVPRDQQLSGVTYFSSKTYWSRMSSGSFCPSRSTLFASESQQQGSCWVIDCAPG